MDDDQKVQDKTFSIAKFKGAFENSRARKYMSTMEIEQIHTAIEEKDVMLLGKLYQILLNEQDSDEKIIQEFVMTKNKIVDKFMVSATEAEKKIVKDPLKKKVAEAEKSEHTAAEDILSKI